MQILWRDSRNLSVSILLHLFSLGVHSELSKGLSIELTQQMHLPTIDTYTRTVQKNWEQSKQKSSGCSSLRQSNQANQNGVLRVSWLANLQKKVNSNLRDLWWTIVASIGTPITRGIEAILSTPTPTNISVCLPEHKPCDPCSSRVYHFSGQKRQPESSKTWSKQ